MPNPTIPAAGGALPAAECSPIDRSYEVMALLAVAEDQARSLSQWNVPNLPDAAGNLALLLEVAGRYASIVHDALEQRTRGESQ